MRKVYLMLGFGIATLTLCCTSHHEHANKNWGFDISGIDTTIRPTDDFFQYVNGEKLKRTVIPASETSYGVFSEINKKNQDKLHLLLDEIASKPQPEHTNAQKIADYYVTAMDSVKLNKEGFQPLKEELEKISSIKNSKDLVRAVAHLHHIGADPCWDATVYFDQKNTNRMVLYLSQSGLGMFMPNVSDRDYYTRTDERSKKIQQAYRDFIAHTFQLLGDDQKSAEKAALLIYDLEVKMAKASMTRLELRNQQAQYNKMSFNQLASKAPAIDWGIYFQEIGVKDYAKQDIIVSQPLFIKMMNELWVRTSLDYWKLYLRWNLVKSYASNMSDDFVKEKFKYYGETLSGLKQLMPRWKRCLTQINDQMGEALGEVYVKKYFQEEAKQKINLMVDNLTAVFEERLNNLEWMSDLTKQQAISKLKAITRKLAYPDKWEDYSALVIKRDSYVQNKMRIEKFNFEKTMSKLGKPADKTIWQMPPQMVNAYYEPLMNEIVFPAGILQSPLFDPQADDAVNYGAIGGVIGHEIVHAFDDEGSQYDKEGNLKNWWTQEDRTKFEERTKVLVDHYNQFVAIDTFHVNGKLTLGENIADLGGLTVAYYAFKKSQKNKTSEKIDGFTPEQRFFLGWAQGWCAKYRDEFLKLALSDVHAPGKARVNVLLSNMPEFYDAFGVKPGDKMYRDEKNRAKIW